MSPFQFAALDMRIHFRLDRVGHYPISPKLVSQEREILSGLSNQQSQKAPALLFVADLESSISTFAAAEPVDGRLPMLLWEVERQDHALCSQAAVAIEDTLTTLSRYAHKGLRSLFLASKL